MIRVLVFLLFAINAHGTSVFPELRECPICGTDSVKLSIGSYSQFGEPDRDLSSSPRFRFASVEICPRDLYASWSDAWGKVDSKEKDKLAGFLRRPSIHLTKAERSIVEGHEKEFRESVWFEPIWARTCDGYRSLDDRRKLENALRIHFVGKHIVHDRVAEDWERRLFSLFRENAIAALKDALDAEWPESDEEQIFAYLRGELLRQAGRDAGALAIFREVIAAENAAGPDDELEWISRWAAEQSVRCGSGRKDSDELVAEIIPEIPDPWRDKKATRDPRWPRHQAAIDVLVRRAVEGERPFQNELWKLLDRKPERLLALLETVDSEILQLRSVDTRWSGWFDELAGQIADGELPSSLADDPNQIRVINMLDRAVGGNREKQETWRSEVLLPAVRKAVDEGGIPEVVIPKNDSFALLPSLPLEDGETTRETPPKPSLDDLSRQLYELWQENPASVRFEIATVFIRILRTEPDEIETTRYPASYFLPAISETEEGRAAIRKELEGEWRGSFWKAACGYAAGLPNASEPFLNHPLVAKADDGLIIKLLRQRSDAGWKNEAMRKLKEEEWISSDIVAYLDSLDLPETRAALAQFAEKVRTEKEGRRNTGMDGRLSTLREIEELRVGKKLAELPIR